jgi:hypothetical protein
MSDRIEKLEDCLEIMCRCLDECCDCPLKEECYKISAGFPVSGNNKMKTLAKYLIEVEDKQ